MTAIFISHSSVDNAAAAEMKAWLEAEGHTSLFLDFDPEAGIKGGSDWEQTLYQKLRQCQAVIALLTPGWLASKWCFAELVLARERMPAEAMASVSSSGPMASAPAATGKAHFSVATDGDGAVLRDELLQEELADLVPGAGRAAVAAAHSADGKRWVAASEGAVRIARSDESNSQMATLPSGFGAISALTMSPDGSWFAVAGGDLLEVTAQEAGMGPQRVVLLDADAGRPLGDALQLPNPALVLRLVFGPDGQHLASVTQSSTIVWIAAPHLWLRRSCAQLAVGIDAMQWQRRLAGVAYPKACL